MNNEPRAGMNLDPEMLAAYIDKRLTPEQRAAVEEQLAKDPDSYTVLVETMKALDEVPGAQLEREVPTAPNVPTAPRRWVIAAGSLAAAAAIALAVAQPQWLQHMIGGNANPTFERLVAVVGERRLMESRLTGGFKFGPMQSVNRGQAEVSAENLQLLAASADLQDQVNARPSAVNLHAAGVAKLLTGSLDEAIQLLQRAQAVDRESAAIWTDLSAAYFARGAANGSDADLRIALDLAQRAVDAAPDSSEALFNRALAAERLGVSEAAGYWQAAADRTADAQWRAEAFRNLQRLRDSSR